MKVESIEIFRVDMPMRDFFKNANHNHNVQPSVVVRVTSDDGFTGIGDVEPVAGYSGLSRDDIADAVEQKLAPALIGANPRASREITQKMDEACDGFDGGKGALSLAMADLHAKYLGVPLYELLGGAVKREVRFNAWIGIKAPEEAGREARGFYERGWRACKVKMGGDVASDAARVLAVRESTGDDFEIRIDANESYGRVEDAVALAHEVEEADIHHFEQPVPRTDIEGLAQVRRSINIPVMADECVLAGESARDHPGGRRRYRQGQDHEARRPSERQRHGRHGGGRWDEAGHRPRVRFVALHAGGDSRGGDFERFPGGDRIRRPREDAGRRCGFSGRHEHGAAYDLGRPRAGRRPGRGQDGEISDARSGQGVRIGGIGFSGFDSEASFIFLNR